MAIYYIFIEGNPNSPLYSIEGDAQKAKEFITNQLPDHLDWAFDTNKPEKHMPEMERMNQVMAPYKKEVFAI